MKDVFGEDKEDLIKVFTFNKGDKLSYIISSLCNIINRWDNIRIYVFNNGGNEDEKK